MNNRMIKKIASIAQESSAQASKQVREQLEQSVIRQVTDGVINDLKQYGIDDLEVVESGLKKSRWGFEEYEEMVENWHFQDYTRDEIFKKLKEVDPFMSDDDIYEMIDRIIAKEEKKSSKKTAQPQYPGPPGGRGRGLDRYKGLGIGGTLVCVCPKCGYEESHEKGTPCSGYVCPKCAQDRNLTVNLVGKGMPHGKGKGAGKKTAQYNEEYNEEEVAQKLNEKSGSNVTGQDYVDWLEGGPKYDKFDKAVKKFLGEETHTYYDGIARLDAKLLWELGLGPDTAGGIDLTSSAPKESSKKTAQAIDLLTITDNLSIAGNVNMYQDSEGDIRVETGEADLMHNGNVIAKLIIEESNGGGFSNLELLPEAKYSNTERFLNWLNDELSFGPGLEVFDFSEPGTYDIEFDFSEWSKPKTMSSKKTAVSIEIKVSSKKYNKPILAVIKEMKDGVVTKIAYDKDEIKKAYDIGKFVITIPSKGRFATEAINEKIALNNVIEYVYKEASPTEKARLTGEAESGDITVQRIPENVEKEQPVELKPITVVYQEPDDKPVSVNYEETEPEWVGSIKDEIGKDAIAKQVTLTIAASLHHQIIAELQEKVDELEIPVTIVTIDPTNWSAQYEGDKAEGEFNFEPVIENDIVKSVKADLALLKGKYAIKTIDIELGDRTFRTEAKNEIRAVANVLGYLIRKGEELRWDGKRLGSIIDDDIIEKIAEEQTRIIHVYKTPNVNLGHWEVAEKDGKKYFNRK